MIKGFTTMYKKLSNWGKVLLFVVLFLIVMFIVNRIYPKPKKEGFESQDEFVFKTGSEIYDGFYANIYDYLVFNSVKDQYEVGEIINSAEPTSQSIVLDVGSGTGHHVGLLGDKGYNVTGLDKSKAMISKAKESSKSLIPGYAVMGTGVVLGLGLGAGMFFEKIGNNMNNF